jgi:hypothetical protein
MDARGGRSEPKARPHRSYIGWLPGKIIWLMRENEGLELAVLARPRGQKWASISLAIRLRAARRPGTRSLSAVVGREEADNFAA